MKRITVHRGGKQVLSHQLQELFHKLGVDALILRKDRLIASKGTAAIEYRFTLPGK